MYLEQNLISQLLGDQGSVPAPAPHCELNGCSLAMVYAPAQTWQNLYEPGKALQQGTLFAELDKPFLGARGIAYE